MKRGILLLILFCSGPVMNMLAQPVLKAEISYSEVDKIVFDRYVKAFREKRNLTIGELVTETARFFLGTPYLASSLESEPERLVINLRAFDCTTFVESVIALARTLRGEQPSSFDSFCNELQRFRYRDGTIGDYTDRLHYGSDWAYENERKGLLKAINPVAGGELLHFSLSFMSTHPDSYRQLKNNPSFLRIIAGKEREISKRVYYYLPSGKIQFSLPEMQSGDVIGFVTTLPGLDLSHMGFIYRQGKVVTFIHASSTAKKVIIQKDSLSSSVLGNKRYKGILLLRPLEP